MSRSEGAGSGADAPRLLGLSRDASAEEVLGAYWRLRAHIEARSEGCEDAGFVEARGAELRNLDRAVQRVRADDDDPERLGLLSPGQHQSAATSPAPGASERTARRSQLIAALFVSVLAGVFAVVLWRHGPPASSKPAGPVLGTLSARAQPAGALLEVLDGEDQHVVARGPADGRSHPLEPGTYLLRVGREDCPDEWTKSVTLEPRQTRAFAPRICLGEGALVVHSNQQRDRVQLDGLDVGSSGDHPHNLPTGDHQVLVQKEGFEPWTGTVRLRPDEQISLHAELVPLRGGGQSGASGAKPAHPAGQPAQGAADATRAAKGPSGRRPPPARLPTAGPDEQAGASSGQLARKGLPPSEMNRTGPGGSKTWHEATRDRLISLYDQNGSRTLDSKDEIQGIPCSEWQNTERSFDTGGLGIALSRFYGFDGSASPGDTLGISGAMRSYAYDRMKQCGLKASL